MGGGGGVACKRILSCVKKCTKNGGGVKQGGKIGCDIQIYGKGNSSTRQILGHLENMNLKKNKGG